MSDKRQISPPLSYRKSGSLMISSGGSEFGAEDRKLLSVSAQIKNGSIRNFSIELLQ